MSNIEKKEKNLNELIDKLNSLSLSYSQPKYEIEKVRTEKKELSRQKNEIEKKNQE
jgi:peptidoglycan hydrolase CwlO-like protein